MALSRVLRSAADLLRGGPRGAADLLRGAPRRVRHLLRGSSKVRTAPYSSHVETKSGVLVPNALTPKESTSERVMKFIKEKWAQMDDRFKDMAVKGVTLTIGGGGGAVMLAKTLLERMDRLEARVNESINGLNGSVTDLKVQVAKLEMETDARYNKLQAQVNGLSNLLRKVNPGGETGGVLANDET